MKKLLLAFVALALVASCTQPPRCSREGRREPAEYWDTGLRNAETLVVYDAVDGTEGIVSVMEDWYKEWVREYGTQRTNAYMRQVAIGLMEIADGKCGGTPSQQRTARKVLDRLRIKLDFG